MPEIDGLTASTRSASATPRSRSCPLGLDRPGRDPGRAQARRERLHRQERQPDRPAVRAPPGRRGLGLQRDRPTRAPVADDAAKAAGLTERETSILTALARGLSNDAIGKELWVAEQTVKFHLTNIYRKLGVSNRTEADPLRLRERARREPARRPLTGLYGSPEDRGGETAPSSARRSHPVTGGVKTPITPTAGSCSSAGSPRRG